MRANKTPTSSGKKENTARLSSWRAIIDFSVRADESPQTKIPRPRNGVEITVSQTRGLTAICSASTQNMPITKHRPINTDSIPVESLRTWKTGSIGIPGVCIGRGD